MVTVERLSAAADLTEYARRLSDLRAVQLAAGEMLTAFLEQDNPAAMSLAYRLGDQAVEIHRELTAWRAEHVMPAASSSAGSLVQRGTGGR